MPATQIADGVWRCGAQINWYLVSEGRHVTVVDAGLPGYRPQLEPTLAQLGRTLGDVAAVLLTHGHPDHIGFAEALRAQTGVPVYVHELDAELARTQEKPQHERSLVPYLGRPRAWPVVAHVLRNGRRAPVKEVWTFGGGWELDVPGRPVAVHVPGHTLGSCAFHFPNTGALLAGDALCARNPFLARRGPQIMPGCFSLSSKQALRSLKRLAGISAAVVGFGHGDPWTGGVAAAIEMAQMAGPS
jgi:glyoxylase-like metal-dependent hydrolase (beta-lactamase superfamily II)